MYYRKIQQQLKKWSERSDRKPLILRGARQVGKTTSVNAFGETFKQYIYLNLETPDDKTLFYASLDIHDLVQTIFIAKRRQFAERSNTLLFIDEIQEVPEALNMLRYFYEVYPEIRV